MKPPISGPTAAAIAAAAPTRAYVAFWAAPSKLPWMSDCIAGSRSDAPRPPITAQKMKIGTHGLGEGHRQGADRVGEQAQDVGALASEQVADLAADQDERGRHQGLERDRGLDGAHVGAEVGDDRRDRDIHDRRVDDQDEHGHRQQDREALYRRLPPPGPERRRRWSCGLPLA